MCVRLNMIWKLNMKEFSCVIKTQKKIENKAKHREKVLFGWLALKSYIEDGTVCKYSVCTRAVYTPVSLFRLC